MSETTRPAPAAGHEGGGAGRQPTPDRIFQTLTADQQTAALGAAVELEIHPAPPWHVIVSHK